MSLHRRAARKDINHRAVVEALEKAGATVEAISGTGVPDLLVGFRGQTYLLEVKAPKGRVTPAQEKWHRTWRGRPAWIVRSPEEALVVIGAAVPTPSVYPSTPKEPRND